MVEPLRFCGRSASGQEEDDAEHADVLTAAIPTAADHGPTGRGSMLPPRLSDHRGQPPRILAAQGPDLGVVDQDHDPIEKGDQLGDRVQLNSAIGPPPAGEGEEFVLVE